MSRYLFVVPPFASHLHPTLAIGQELARRGHAVAWVTYAVMKATLPDSAQLFALDSSISEPVAQDLRKKAGASWMAGMKVLFEQIIVPLARDMLPGVEAAIKAFEPDLVIVDQHALAGALAARRMQRRWATSAPTAALVGDSFGGYPKVEAWIVGLFDQLQRDAGLDPVRWPDRSTELVLLYTSRLLAGADIDFPAHYHFVGPALDGRSGEGELVLEHQGHRRRIFVSLGMQFAQQGQRFFNAIAEALADTPLQVIVHAPDGLLHAPPVNFIVRSWFPLMRLLPTLDALVSHAGSTVNEALAHDVPAVVAPIVHDQSIIAQRAVAAGAAVRVAFRRANASELRAAVFEVLDVPSYKAAAQRIGASFRAAGGAGAAATAIERLQ